MLFNKQNYNGKQYAHGKNSRDRHLPFACGGFDRFHGGSELVAQPCGVRIALHPGEEVVQVIIGSGFFGLFLNIACGRLRNAVCRAVLRRFVRPRQILRADVLRRVCGLLRARFGVLHADSESETHGKECHKGGDDEDVRQSFSFHVSFLLFLLRAGTSPPRCLYSL